MFVYLITDTTRLWTRYTLLYYVQSELKRGTYSLDVLKRPSLEVVDCAGLKHEVFDISEAAAVIIDCHGWGQNPMASNSSISRSHTINNLKKKKKVSSNQLRSKGWGYWHFVRYWGRRLNVAVAFFFLSSLEKWGYHLVAKWFSEQNSLWEKTKTCSGDVDVSNEKHCKNGLCQKSWPT